ncbi:MAG: peptide ABC transporter substrate-binding protein [Lachnospiraceae bacterium]|nr:peptide ABC transporter substrate-binding protein [Lachnospiraceae bacterium]
MKKKVLSLVLASAMVLSLTACGQEKTPATIEVASTSSTEASASTEETSGDVEYVRGDDDEIYEEVLGGYAKLCEEAKAASSVDERYMLFAQAEAYLLDSAVFVPVSTRGGLYAISRRAPKTKPEVQWGNDDDRLKWAVISDEFTTKEEYDEMLDLWAKAVAGEGEYDAAAYLKSKGHSIKDELVTTFQTAPVTIDWLNTSSQADTEITVNCVDGLVEYNPLGQMEPALAESWDISEDGTVYTFHIRPGVYWYTSEGQQYAEVTAEDFVAGLHHMLDTQAGLEWLIDGVIVGGTDYYANGGSWDNVGYKAVDKYTLEVTLEQPVSYFLTMLTYSCFLPICASFYEAHGGVYGVEEYAAASADTNTYTFGNSDDVASQVYCGAFLLQKLLKDSEIVIVANPNYYNKETVNVNKVRWVYDNNENPSATYDDAVAGVYVGMNLTVASGLLDKAKADGNFDKYAHITETESVTYFGGLNVNRGTYALESGTCASTETEQQKIDTHTALMNKNFRKAFVHAYEKAAYNAVTASEDLKLTSLRNMYTHPQFVQLENEVTDKDGHSFPAGTFYGDMVQYYLDQLGETINVQDGVDGWFDKAAALSYLDAAKQELGDSVTFPINIDIVYYSANDNQVAQANTFKTVMEENLGTENVVINLIEATTPEDYYASGYRASNGEAGNFDFFQGSGWGPDYGDPSTYLDTFLGEGAGYMTKVIGLY